MYEKFSLEESCMKARHDKISLQNSRNLENIDELIYCYRHRPKKIFPQNNPTPEHYNLNRRSFFNLFTSKTDDFRVKILIIIDSVFTSNLKRQFSSSSKYLKLKTSINSILNCIWYVFKISAITWNSH